MNSTALSNFLLKYAGLIQSVEDQPVFTGNVKVKDKWFRIHISCPRFPSAVGSKLTIYDGLKSTTLTDQNFSLPLDIDQMIQDIPSCLNESTPTEALKPVLDISQVYREILELKSTSYKIHINSQGTTIRFSNFHRFKEHFMELRCSETNKFTLFDHSLPNCIQWNEIFGTASSIKAYLTDFLKLLEDLRDFYTNLADIDELCYVVQPLRPSTKDDWRILKLKDKVFVKLVLDPFSSLPSVVNVIGPTYEVESLRGVLSEGLRNWDGEMDVHTNLLRTFELAYFPMADESVEQFCNICYCYQLEGHVPFVSCDNRRCNLVYHAVCLKEWFATLTDGKVFLDVAFGACPFCKEKLSTSFDELLK